MTSTSGGFPPPQPWPPPQPQWAPGARPVVPGTVQAAVIVTYLCCGLAALMTLFLVAAVAFMGAVFFRSFGADVPVDVPVDLVVAVLGSVLLFLLGCVAACSFAWAVWRRKSWARFALAGCSVLALALSVVTMSPPSLVVLPGSITVLVLLFLPQSNAWFRELPAISG